MSNIYSYYENSKKPIPSAFTMADFEEVTNPSAFAEFARTKGARDKKPRKRRSKGRALASRKEKLRSRGGAIVPYRPSAGGAMTPYSPSRGGAMTPYKRGGDLATRSQPFPTDVSGVGAKGSSAASAAKATGRNVAASASGTASKSAGGALAVRPTTKGVLQKKFPWGKAGLGAAGALAIGGAAYGIDRYRKAKKRRLATEAQEARSLRGRARTALRKLRGG